MGGFPTFDDLLTGLAVLGDRPAALGILATALILVIARDWRLSLFALAGQYILSGWLLTQVLAPQIAILKILAGMMICVVLYITARQIRWNQDSKDASPTAKSVEYLIIGRWRCPTGILFRLLIGILTAVVVFHTTNSGQITLPGLEPHINLAAVALMALGILNLGLSDEPFIGGIGLLTVMSGFDLLYHSLEQAITVIGFLIGISFVIALVTAYLTVAQHLKPDRS